MKIEINNLSKRLGSFRFSGLTVEFPRGYMMGLIGQNGAGKTSLLHLILGLYTPDEGEVLLDGMSYKDKEKEIREKIGTVLAEELFEPWLSLKQNGDLYGKYYKNYEESLLDFYLKRFELDKKRKYKTLSKGEKLKFQFAFALAHKPSLLILDEPTGNFDPKFRKEFFEVLKEFMGDGEHSVILTTHLTEDLERRADYIVYLEQGNVVFSGDIESMRESYRLVTGEEYKIKLIQKEQIIWMEKGAYGTRALVRHRRNYPYDKSLTVAVPSIEECMYFISKKGKRG